MIKRYIVFLKKNHRIFRLERDIKCTFDKTAEIFSSKLRKSFAQTLETIKKCNSFEKNSSKRSSGHVECSFDKRA